MRNIPIYKVEKEAGLAQLIQTNASIAYLSPALLNKAPDKNTALSLPAIKNRAIAVNQNQIDLFYLKDILVSTGWNLNDDVFTLCETWAGRNTATDKQFNLGHNQKIEDGKITYINNIIGHMTSQYCIDTKGETLANDLAIDELPDKFHIVSESVIYRYWPDKEHMEKVNSIIAQIEAQTDDKPLWFVSMEALFDDFDYALVDSKGKQTVVSRTEASAFLTKHLRSYGGKGVYKEYKVGRLLKNIVFSGKGLVENPANPESVIFNDTTPFKASANEINSEFLNGLGYAINSNLILMENNSMNEKEQLLQKQLDETKAALKVEQTAKADLEKKLTDEANKAVQAKVDELTKTTEAAVKAKNESEAQHKKLAEAAGDLAKKLEESQAALAKANEALAKIETEKRVLARKNDLVSKLGVDETVANELVETLAALTDEAFAKYVDKAPKASAKEAELSEEDKKKKKKEEDDAAYAASEKGKAEAAKKALDNAQAGTDLGAAPVNQNSDVEATRKKIRETFAASRPNKNKIDEPAKK